MHSQTIAIDSPFASPDPYGALSMPVYHSVAYEFATAEEMADAFVGRVVKPDYSRTMNPTVSYFEEKVRTITGAKSVTAFSSGMAAISAAMIAIAEQGQNIVASRHMFGNTFSFLTRTMARWGVETRLVDLTDLDAVRTAVDEHTAALFVEIITNPQMEVADISALAAITHTRDVPIVADTTVIPFTEFSAKSLGVDIEVVSSTKYISGGATGLGGLIIDYGTLPRGFEMRVKWEVLFNLGAYMTPHVAYMQSLGLETLHARYHEQNRNAQTLAERLTTLPAVKKVGYVGLPQHPQYELARRQFGSTSGCMITIDLADKQTCMTFLNRLRIVHRATNLFDNRSLAIHPASTIFGGFSPRQRLQMDVLDTTIRLSVGLESTDDIFEDIQQAAQNL